MVLSSALSSPTSLPCIACPAARCDDRGRAADWGFFPHVRGPGLALLYPPTYLHYTSNLDVATTATAAIAATNIQAADAASPAATAAASVAAATAAVSVTAATAADSVAAVTATAAVAAAPSAVAAAAVAAPSIVHCGRSTWTCASNACAEENPASVVTSYGGVGHSRLGNPRFRPQDEEAGAQRGEQRGTYAGRFSDGAS